MPSGWWGFVGTVGQADEPVKVGRPHRDRAKVKAGRKAARRNRRRQ
jgi:hypothetical protein